MHSSPEIERLLAAPAPDCVELMRHGSKSFFAASRLLPARYRDAAVSLYAFCRVADDEVDGSGASPDTLAALHRRLDAVYAGTPHAIAADQAFARVVHRYRLPRRIPLALLEGFQWDAQGRRYRTFEELLDYCARVAGTVGAMMALVMEVRDERALARACELGVAMQLTNIARDVGADAQLGRLYLPAQWMREAGLDPDAWLAAPQFNEALGRVVARLLAAADTLYRRAEHGIAALPRTCRPAMVVSFWPRGARASRRSIRSATPLRCSILDGPPLDMVRLLGWLKPQAYASALSFQARRQGGGGRGR
jgi:phytoene synthase